MEFQTFWSQKKLLKIYNKRSSKNREGLLYIVLRKEKQWFFFTKIKVVFFTKKEVEKKIYKLLYQILEKEFNLKIKTINFFFSDKSALVVNLDVQNKSLLVGNFGQNLRSLNLFLSHTLSHFLMTKFSVEINFFGLKDKKNNFKSKPNSKNRKNIKVLLKNEGKS